MGESRTDAYDQNLSAVGLRVVVVASRFNTLVCDRLVQGALEFLRRSGARDEDVRLIRVAGVWELPLTVDKVAAQGGVQAIVALGCLIRGDTIHFDLIAVEAVRGLSLVAHAREIPVSLGVLATNTLEQALDRSGGTHGNKGADAASAAVEQALLFASLLGPPPASLDRRG